MIYKTETIRIRPFVRADITEKYRGWFHDPETTKYNSHGLFPYTTGQMEAFIKTIEEGDSSKIVWAIEVLEKISSGGLPGGKSYEEYMTCQHVGNVSLQSINLLNRSAELAIVIGEASARGKGVGKVACQFILDHAFMSLGLNRVWTGTAAPNIAMQKTCEHIGMAEEGRFKQGMFLNGYFTDVIAYGITANEYFSKKGEE